MLQRYGLRGRSENSHFMKITLDTNCLVDLELREGAYIDLRKIISSYNLGNIEVSVPGIGASERLKGGSFAKSFTVFQERLRRISPKELGILKPLAYWDISYWDWSILGGEDNHDLERKIHNILFPEHQFIWSDQAKLLSLDPNSAASENHKEFIKWRNRKCDVLGLWCHIFYANDILVTRDKDFHKKSKRPLLINLGAKSICCPSEVPL
jgi:hypothetical protein